MPWEALPPVDTSFLPLRSIQLDLLCLRREIDDSNSNEHPLGRAVGMGSKAIGRAPKINKRDLLRLPSMAVAVSGDAASDS